MLRQARRVRHPVGEELPVRPGAARAPKSPSARVAGPRRKPVPSALEPRRYKTREGWEVWIGKNNQGNDHLTHRLARPEDVWMHVHGAAGSHVVIRREDYPIPADWAPVFVRRHPVQTRFFEALYRLPS